MVISIAIFGSVILGMVVLFILFNDFISLGWEYIGEKQIEGIITSMWQSKDKTVYQIKVAGRYIEVSDDYITQSKIIASLVIGDRVLVWASQNKDSKILFKENIWHKPHNDRNVSLA